MASHMEATSLERFLVHILTPVYRLVLFPVPTPGYTSTPSAPTVSNVKCVPISHKNVITGSKSRLSWLKKVWPQQDINMCTRMVAMVLSHDIGAALLTAGCYVFGVVPSSYQLEMLPRTRLAALAISSYLPSFWTWLLPRKQPPLLLVSHGFSKASWRHWRMNRMRQVRLVS